VVVNVTVADGQKVSPLAELLILVVTVADRFDTLISFKGSASKSPKIKIKGEDRQSVI